jgi:hemerythrin-like domain-containing protein
MTHALPTARSDPMPVPLGARGQADFTQPIDLMMDCHRRIEHFLDVLITVVSDAPDGELDGEYRAALETALRYFQQGAPRHTEDEEHSLFPRLRQLDDPRARQVLAQMDALEADHRGAEAAHARVDDLGQRWLREGRLTTAARAELRDLLAAMRQTYARHIRMEDQQLFPLARRLLEENKLQQIGQEMRQRRDANPGRAGSRCAERRQTAAQKVC